MTNRKLIGTFGVDSGQVMLVDPCYLKDYENNTFDSDAKNDNTFSYRGACSQTCFNEERGGQLKSKLGYDIAVAASTGHGDGSYQVYATYEDDRIKKLEVEFF